MATIELCKTTDVDEGTAKKVETNGLVLAVFNLNGAFYVMDRAFLDFERLHRWHEAGAFFVVRARANLNFERRYSAPVDRSTGLICDQTITLNVYYSKIGRAHV